MKGFASIATALMLSIPASATAMDDPFISGNSFLASCENSGSGGFVEGLCYGYITGVLRYGNVFNERWCVNHEVNNLQIMDTVLAYIRNTPEKRHWSLALLVNNALAGAFPCPKGVKK